MEPYFEIKNAKIYKGDCTEVLKQLPEKIVQTCVTSPPYYGLRDYGVDGQIGLEESPEEYVEKLVEVFREVKRVLKDDGTLWLNIGDSYYNYRPGKGQSLVKQSVSNTNQDLPSVCARRGNKLDGLKEKDLIGIPWMLAFALRADGWYLRQDIIWSKVSPMPESVKDRCTKAHEYIFLLSKNPRYYYDHESIKVEASKATLERNKHKFTGAFKGQFKGSPTDKRYQEGIPIDEPEFSSDGKANKKSVWTVSTKPFKGAHFATFPPDLIEPCILAGCPKHGFVLDPFSGSGTAGQVALDNDRKYIGIDLNPEYIELSKTRVDRNLIIKSNPDGSKTEIRQTTLSDLF